MDSHRLSFYFSSATVAVAAIVVAIVLAASLDAGGDGWIDLSRLRGLILLVSAAILVISLYIAVRSRTPAGSVAGSTPPEPSGATVAGRPGEVPATGLDDDTLERLSEDERTLYDMVREAGGDMLQMNIVSSKVFSKAKVTRTLDKLESRGLVVRERHGMTNRVRIIR